MEENTLVKGFNSTLVQLKGSSWTYNHVPHSCFNSTLVQLKDILTLAMALIRGVSILP